MRVIRGTHRIVFVFERFGFVLKFPHIRWKEAWTNFQWCLKNVGVRGLRYSITNPDGALYDWFGGGFVEHWGEFRMFHEHPMPFLLPTHFSLFGIMNIQRLGVPCRMSDREVYGAFANAAGAGVIFQDAHHFLNADNFCRDPKSGEFMMLDYGGRVCREILEEVGGKLLFCLPDALEKVGCSYWKGRP